MSLCFTHSFLPRDVCTLSSLEVTAIECLTKTVIYHYSFPSRLQDLPQSMPRAFSLSVDSVCLQTLNHHIIISLLFPSVLSITHERSRDAKKPERSHLVGINMRWRWVPVRVWCHSCRSTLRLKGFGVIPCFLFTPYTRNQATRLYI